MAIKTFEREVKKLSSEFTNLIENYNFEEYDFHSIRQTLQDYIEQTYPNYNDYFRSDYVMMLIELFAFYGEMMAYRVDMNMNEAYLSTAKDRRNIIKIADMLGYKYDRIEPSVSIAKINITNDVGGSFLLTKVKKHNTIDDILSKSSEITFELAESETAKYHQYKLDYLLKNVTAEDFMNTLNNVFTKLKDYNYNDNIKTKRVFEDTFEYYERSIFVDKFQMGFTPNSNIYVTYAGSTKMFELQNLKFDNVLYFNTENTVDALTYDVNNLYSNIVELGFEFVLKYDKGGNIIDKNVYMYIPIVQGGTFTREINFTKTVKGFKTIAFEKNIFNNPTLVRQYDTNNNIIRTYYQVDNLNNHTYKYAYEVNNTPEGHLELIFGDGKNSEVLLPATKTLLFYRKNESNSDELFNVKNADLPTISLLIEYYDNHINKTQKMSLPIYMLYKFSADGGLSAESNEEIKYMARKLRSVQDRFVTAADYETAGMLHPRVKYSTVILRTYIGKNSARMSNEFLDVYFDSLKNPIDTFQSIEPTTNKIIDTFIIASTAYFTESSVNDMYDYITFNETKDAYYFEIFDVSTITPNEWFKYPEKIVSEKSKGTVLKITNAVITSEIIEEIVNISNINNILPLEHSITAVTFSGCTPKNINLKLSVSTQLDRLVVENSIDQEKEHILKSFNKLFLDYNIANVKLISISDGYSLSLTYTTKAIRLPEKDLSFVWTHYKSDDLYINPSKSNIVEIYVTGVKKDLKKNISSYEALTSSEINKLISDINTRKMISDIVQVYNSSVYTVEIAIKVYKNTNTNITNELLRSKIDKEIDKFFDIVNIPLGKHFHMSKLIEWLHRNIPEIQHIEMLVDEKGDNITPSSTLNTLGERIVYTQIVEKKQEINNNYSSVRRISII